MKHLAQCLVFGKNSVLLGVNNTVRLSQAGSSGGTGGAGGVMSPPLLVPSPFQALFGKCFSLVAYASKQSC